jgi:predicted ATPase
MMPIRTLFVRGYRSIQRLHVRLGQVNVIVGPNASGKSNLYRSLYLLAAAAEGRLARTLAEEGGMPSVLWAGEQRKGLPRRFTLDVRSDEWSYEFACGLSAPSSSAFVSDPFVRHERLSFLGTGRPVDFCTRTNGSAPLRDELGGRVNFPMALSDSESILSELREPHRYPELSQMRSTLLGWRFYHQFRTDADSPLRRPQIAVRTPVLGHDGQDLAAALATVEEIGDSDALAAAVDQAFPGSRLEVTSSPLGMRLELAMPEFRRRFQAYELSDGTLKYLCLMAALLSPRPPGLLALNEPDANLHPQLFEPLAEMLAYAAKQSQLWITTHSDRLAHLIQARTQATPIGLEKRDGATMVVGSNAGELDFDDGAEEDLMDHSQVRSTPTNRSPACHGHHACDRHAATAHDDQEGPIAAERVSGPGRRRRHACQGSAVE